MKATLGISCAVILPFFYVLQSEKCVHQEKNMYHKRVEEGEVLGIDCLLYTMPYRQHTNYTVHWYINGSNTPITKENSSRIHQQDSVLLFLPVTYHDSGSYECITHYRNSTRCYKSNFQIAVLNNSASLCFNEKLFYKQKIPISTNAKLVCNYMDDVGQETDDLSINWYKGCEPLQGERFVFFESYVIIKNVRNDDMGKYQCKGSYSYLGQKFNFSRSIQVSVLAS